jgi:hypothetical protein
MSDDNTQDGAEPSPASAGSQNTHMATARLSAANTWLQEEIRRLRLTATERGSLGRAAAWLAKAAESRKELHSAGYLCEDAAVLRSILERFN